MIKIDHFTVNFDVHITTIHQGYLYLSEQASKLQLYLPLMSQELRNNLGIVIIIYGFTLPGLVIYDKNDIFFISLSLAS